MRAKPRWIQIGASSAAAREYRVALAWWQAALGVGIEVPLAPRLMFPQVGAEGCLFVFTDAARENGTGFGGFTAVKEGEVVAWLLLSDANPGVWRSISSGQGHM